MTKIDLAFQEQQADFCQWIRSPLPHPHLGLTPERIQIYRELLYNNVSAFIEVVYPVAKSLLPTDVWEKMCQDFFTHSQCQSPFYNDISLQFREYLIEVQHSALSDYPWLSELLQFEWLELYLDTAEIEEKQTDNNLTDYWQLSLPVWVLVYQYPVYEWHEAMDIAEIEPRIGAIMTWRNVDDQICIEKISPLYAFLINEINEQVLTELELIQVIETQVPSLQKTVIDEILKDLKLFLQQHHIMNL